MNKNSEKAKFPIFERRGNSSELVIALHAYKHNRHRLFAVRNRIANCKPDADIFVPNLPFGFCSFVAPVKVISELLCQIDQMWKKRELEGEPYKSIVFVGHSMGALFARQLYVCACGENNEAPFFNNKLNARTPRPWASCVERIILLAGMNRGWSINHHLSLLGAVLWKIGVWLGNFIKMFRKGEPIIYSIRRGSIFITELRIQWLLMRSRSSIKNLGNAVTIQLLGSIDDMVSPADNIDLISGRDFVYFDVPESGHANIIDMDESAVGEGRGSVFEMALTADRGTLENRQMLPADNPSGEQQTNVEEVIFVIHGIRDAGYWTHKVARRVREKAAQQNIKIATETASYGYFPMLRFLLSKERRKKTDWFMDRYVEALALYPNARFSFIGHSNGTYLLAKALQDYSCCRFHRVVFAGSVVGRKYNWEKYINSGQVQDVANYVATADWVVAFFPKAIQMLRLQDLGSAGHDGFHSESISQVNYVKGSHGAAIKEENWDSIADFIIDGSPAKTNHDLLENARSPFVLIPGYVAPFVWLLIALVLLAIAYLIVLTHTHWQWREWQTTVLMIGYCVSIWKVLTKL